MAELAERDLKNSALVNEDLKRSKRTDFVSLIKQYSIPIVSIILFLAIIIIAIYPTATSIYSNISELEKLKAEKDKNQTTINALVKLREKDFQNLNDLTIVDNIVPSEKTKIVGLQKFIEEKVTQYNLVLKEMNIGEQLQKVGDGTPTASSANPDADKLDQEGNPIKKTEDSLRVAPTTAKIEGKFSDIQKFFTDFYKVNDLYIIDSMNLKSSGTIAPSDLLTSDVKWSLDITFAKYAFSEDFLTDETQFSKIPPSTVPDQTVLDYLRQRFSK